jgi:hypothetical protein
MGQEGFDLEIYGADGRKDVEYLFIRVLKIPSDSMYRHQRHEIEGCVFAAEKNDVINWIKKTGFGARHCINLIDFIGNCPELCDHHRLHRRWFGPYVDAIEILTTIKKRS